MVWRDIVGYEGLYQISESGDVRSLAHSHLMRTKNGIVVTRARRGKELKPFSSGATGYLKISLVKDGVGKKLFIHRLVAEAFVPNDNGLPTVNHIDGNKLNNHYLNLEWCTQRDNLAHAANIGLRDPAPNRKRVVQCDLDGTPIAVWRSYKDVERVLGFCSANVWQCAKGKTHTAYGYRWIRADN